MRFYNKKGKDRFQYTRFMQDTENLLQWYKNINILSLYGYILASDILQEMFSPTQSFPPSC